MESKEQMIEQFIELLSGAGKGEFAEPKIFRFNLDTARTKEHISFAGNFISLIDSSNAVAWVKINFNRIENDQTKFTKGLSIRRPYTQFWLTHDAQAGEWVDILAGAVSPGLLEIIDNRSATDLLTALENVRDELRGDTSPENWDTEKTIGLIQSQVLAANTNRKGFMVQAKGVNAGIIYIGFDDTVTSTKWIAELQAGQSLLLDDYRGAVHAIASVAGQLLGYGEW